MINKNIKLLALISLSFAALSMQESKWQISYDSQRNEYVGKKLKFPNQHGEFRYFEIRVSCQNNKYEGNSLNDYAEGNAHPLHPDYAKKYFEKFRDIKTTAKPTSK